MTRFEVITRTGDPLPSPCRVEPPTRPVLRVGVVQCAWNPDPAEHRAALRDGIRLAAEEGAQIVLLQELTLSPYFCVDPDVENALARYGENAESGPTATLARELAALHGIAVQASLFERTEDNRGFNTAICVDASGRMVACTRKTHIPEFPYYHEDRYFEPSDDDCPVTRVGDVNFGFPTCWDQWFPELARSLSLAGAEVIVYPTAIGSEPQLPGG